MWFLLMRIHLQIWYVRLTCSCRRRFWRNPGETNLRVGDASNAIVRQGMKLRSQVNLALEQLLT